MISPAIAGNDEKTQKLFECTRDMDAKQLAANIDKYIKGHPEIWHRDLSAESLNALIGVCPEVMEPQDDKNRKT
jgi:hypothetical protein